MNCPNTNRPKRRRQMPSDWQINSGVILLIRFEISSRRAFNERAIGTRNEYAGIMDSNRYYPSLFRPLECFSLERPNKRLQLNVSTFPKCIIIIIISAFVIISSRRRPSPRARHRKRLFAQRRVHVFTRRGY